MSELDVNYPKPWKMERVADRLTGRFRYEFRDANYDFLFAIDEDDFVGDPDDPEDKQHIGDALAIARHVLEKVNTRS